MGRSGKRHTKAHSTVSVDCDPQLHPSSYQAPHCTSLLHLGGCEWRYMSNAVPCTGLECSVAKTCCNIQLHPLILRCVSWPPVWVVLRVSPAMPEGCPTAGDADCCGVAPSPPPPPPFVSATFRP